MSDVMDVKVVKLTYQKSGKNIQIEVTLKKADGDEIKQTIDFENIYNWMYKGEPENCIEYWIALSNATKLAIVEMYLSERQILTKYDKHNACSL